jgi:hypothetical protein
MPYYSCIAYFGVCGNPLSDPMRNWETLAEDGARHPGLLIIKENREL